MLFYIDYIKTIRVGEKRDERSTEISREHLNSEQQPCESQRLGSACSGWLTARTSAVSPENPARFGKRMEAIIQVAESSSTSKWKPIICSMGAGNKLDPTQFEVTDIYKTSVCPLAKVMRKELKARGIKKLKVVYSKEQPVKPSQDEAIKSKEKPAATPLETRSNTAKRQTPGSTAFVPSVVGLIIASQVVSDLIK